MLRHFASLAAFVAIPAAAQAPFVHVDGWAQAGVGSAAAYLSLHNGGREPDRLLALSSPLARSVSVHRTVSENGISRMRSVGVVALAPNGMVTMKPGDLHVMVMGLRGPLRPGTRLPLTLRFERAGNVTVDLPVRAPGTANAAPSHHGH